MCSGPVDVFFTARKRSSGKVISLLVSVCYSLRRGMYPLPLYHTPSPATDMVVISGGMFKLVHLRTYLPTPHSYRHLVMANEIGRYSSYWDAVLLKLIQLRSWLISILLISMILLIFQFLGHGIFLIFVIKVIGSKTLITKKF